MVTIPVEEYYELRKFKENVKDYGKVYRVKRSYFGETVSYMSHEKVILEITEVNKTLIENGENLQREIRDIKTFSIWKFLKWRKS